MSDNVPNSIKPGMSYVAVAGETLLIQDSKGEQIAIEVRDNPAVIQFLAVVDNYLSARKEGVEGVVLESLWRKMVGEFNSLPVRIHKQLPSFSALGLIVP